MSCYGPAPTTRLVLYAHSLFMDRDGTHCWVGVRHLATVTGLDKSTVAEHRTAAIAAGWLIGRKRPRGGPSTDLQAALPDGIVREASTVSGTAGQQPSNAPPLSGLSAGPVRDEPCERPARPDAPLRPILPFKSARELSGVVGQTLRRKSRSTLKSTDVDLLNWLAQDPRAADYRSDPEALIRMTPEVLRFRGYEDAIRQFVQGLKQGSDSVFSTRH